MARSQRKRHSQHRQAPAVIVRKSRAEQASAQDAERSRTLATLRASLVEMAGLDNSHAAAADAATTQTQAAIRETQSALATLARLTPDVLERMPDLTGQLRDVARLAGERLRAGGSGAASKVTRDAPRLDLVREAPTGSAPIAAGNAAGWAGMGLAGVRHDAMGVPNADYLRRLATKNPWVQAAITTRKQQIGRADITVMPDDPLAPFDASIQDAVEDLLNYPNELKDSYRSLVEPVIDDILTLDRGCVSKDLDARGIPHHLYVEDGATIRIFADWQGERDKPRYLFVPPGTAPGVMGGSGSNQQGVALYNDQLICVMANAASYRFGLAPTQVLLDTIRGDLAATEKAMALVRDVPPPHLVNIKTSQGSGVAQKTIDGVRTEYERRIAGQREIMFLGADDLQVFPLMFSLKDNQFLEWQVYLARKICACYQISPQQIGITFDVNKATAEVQQDLFEDSGLLPLMLLLEEYWNRELLADFAPRMRGDASRPDMRRLNLRVFYPEISELARMRHAEQVIATAAKGLGNLPLLTPNQSLEMLGREPVAGGNTFWVMTQTNGPLPWLSYDGETGAYGSFATPGDLGAQDPAGGIDEDAREPEDVSDEKADRSKPATESGGAGAETAVGNETTGSGGQPNINDADGNPVSQGASGGGGAKSLRLATQLRAQQPAQLAQPAHVPVWLLRSCDARKPGTPWSPAMDSLTRQRAAHLATHGGYPERYNSGFTLNESAAEVAVVSPPPSPLMLRAIDTPTAKAVKDTKKPTPTPIGRVLPDVAATRTPPRKRQEAQHDLSAEVKKVFEEARKRGQRQGA